MGWQPLLATLHRSRQEFTEKLADLLKGDLQQTKIYCRAGCSNCCTMAVNSSFPEALIIARSLSSEQQTAVRGIVPKLIDISQQAADFTGFLRQYRSEIGPCPLLEKTTQRCGIYPDRPFSCRALLSSRPAGWCQADFSKLHPLEKQAFISSLDREVVAFPSHYLAQPQLLGKQFEVSILITMHDHFNINLGGNLLYLIWLELEYALGTLLKDHPAQAAELLRSQQQSRPFLLQLSPEAETGAMSIKE